MSDEEIRAAAIEFAKRNKEKIARELTDKATYLPEIAPISVFMAGSPGAGKTEFSKNLIAELEEGERRVVRIDGDEIRARIPGYTGANSHLVQGAVALVVEKIHDRVLHHGQSFVLDGMLSHYDKATDNIRRSLGKKRPVTIFYVFQKPEVAWRFTEAREKVEGRNIPKDAFVRGFLGAMQTVQRLRQEFGEEVAIRLVKKDYEKNAVEKVITLSPGGNFIDSYLGDGYTEDAIKELLS